MRKFLTLLLIFYSSVVFSQIGGKNFIDQNYIEVTGNAEKEITPDKIYLKIIINEKDYKGKTLVDVEKTMFAKLIDLGFDLSKDLAIKDILSNFKNYWLIKDDILLSKEYQLTVNDAKTTGKTFIELQKLGISNVSINRVESSKITEYRREVKIEAIKAALDKAKDMAHAINQETGRAIYIQEIANDFRPLTGSSEMGSNIIVRSNISQSAYGADSSEPDIEFEKIKLDYSIIVRFELK